MSNNFFFDVSRGAGLREIDIDSSFPEIVTPHKVSSRDENYYLVGYFVSYEDWIDGDRLFEEVKNYGFRRIVNSNCEFLLFLFDKTKHKLRVCVDQFLSFACYFSVTDQKIFFSSDFARIKNEIRKRTNLIGDLDGVLTGLLWSWHMTERTLIQQIKRVPSGSIVEFGFNDSEYRIKSLLDIDGYLGPIDAHQYVSLREFAFDWVKIMEDVVRQRWMKIPSGTKVGCDVSSGFDCTLVAYCLSRVAGPTAFTCYSRYSDLLKDETNIEVVKKFTDRHGLRLEVVNATRPQLYEADLAEEWSVDDPFQIAIHGQQTYLGLLNKNGVRVCFGGEGGDESYRLRGMELFWRFPRQHSYFLEVINLKKYNNQVVFSDKALDLFLDWGRFNRRKDYPMIISDSGAIALSNSYEQFNNVGLRYLNPFFDTRLIALGRQLPEVPGKKKWDLKMELMRELKSIFVDEMYLPVKQGNEGVVVNFARRQRKLIDMVLQDSVLANFGLVNPDKIGLMLDDPNSEIYTSGDVAISLENIVKLDWFFQKNGISSLGGL